MMAITVHSSYEKALCGLDIIFGLIAANSSKELVKQERKTLLGPRCQRMVYVSPLRFPTPPAPFTTMITERSKVLPSQTLML